MSISKIIQSSPVECLDFLMEDVTMNVLAFLRSPTCKANAQLFESLLSLILGVEQK